MFQKIKSIASSLLYVYRDQLFLRIKELDGRAQIHPCSLDGELGTPIDFPHREYIHRTRLYDDIWVVSHNSHSSLADTIGLFGIGGSPMKSIPNINLYPRIIPLSGGRIYLASNQLIQYNRYTDQYKDLGRFPLGESAFYKGFYAGMHLFSNEWDQQLVAMRDKDGEGLKEVYRLDFAESDRCYTVFAGKEVPGQVYFINFYGSDLWVATYKNTYRIDVTTGKTIETQEDVFLPKMSLDGHLGYSIYSSYYKIFDFKAGRMIHKERLGKFAYDGKEYSAEYEGLLYHEGLLYVSVRVTGIFFLAIFDTQTEKFIWQDLWGGWDISEVHIIGDRMVARGYDEVRIYQRTDTNAAK